MNVDRSLVGLCYYNGTHFNAEIVKLQYDALNVTYKPILSAEMKQLEQYWDFYDEELRTMKLERANITKLTNNMKELNTAQAEHNIRLEAKMKDMADNQEVTAEEFIGIKQDLKYVTEIMSGLKRHDVSQHNISLNQPQIKAQLATLYKKLSNHTNLDQKVTQMDTKITTLYKKLSNHSNLDHKVTLMDTKLTTLSNKLGNQTHFGASSNNLEQKVNQMALAFNHTRDRVDTYFANMQSSVDSKINAITQKQWQMEQMLNTLTRMISSMYATHQNQTQ